MTTEWPNRGKGAQTANVVNRDGEMRYTKTEVVEKPRSPDWEKKKGAKK